MWKIPYLANEVQYRATSNSVPFIALTETWLKPYVQNAQLHIENYNIFRCDRGTRVGGGVLLYAHQDLPITNVITYDDKFCQLLMCTCESSKMVICVMYRPPNAPVDSFKSCLKKVHEYTNGLDDYEICLLGDFNFPNISWDPISYSYHSESTDELLQYMSDNLLSQYILQPTRNDNILDLFITNNSSLVTHVTTSNTELSDHQLVEIYFSYNPCQPNYTNPPTFEPAAFRSLDFTKADFNTINSTLSKIDWDDLAASCSEEEFPKMFTHTLLEACRTGCPMKSPPKRKSSRLLRTLSRKKRKFQAILDRVIDNPKTPQSQINSLNRKIALTHYAIRDAICSERKFREEQACGKVKINPKYFYSYAKKFSKQKRSITMLFDGNNNICTSPNQIANILQNQFTSVFSNPAATDLSSADNFYVPDISDPHTDEQLSFTHKDIIEAIDEITSNAAPGPDGIPPIVLKNCKEYLAEPIYIIWSHSFSSGIVPTYYKMSYIAPLYKKGSHALPANYRPVSLTSHIIKIFERVIRKQLVHYLEFNNLLCSKQHGFRSGHSCLTQLLHHFDDILENYMNGSDTDCIYLDYAKAFDKVDHSLLIAKLNKYGINPKVIQWIDSFLSNRTQHVAVDGHMSFPALIISGVPQGTVLGPILFLIFINDITGCITSSTIRCFADDTRICKAIKSEIDVAILQRDLNTVIQWSINNNMTLHEDKFEYMCHSFMKSNLLHELPFVSQYYQYSTSNGGTLSPIYKLRDLGVTVCQDLSWSPHIRSITDKARQKAAWVLSVFHTRSVDVMLCLYKSMVRSLLEFCSPLWNPTKISDIQEIESVQKSFTSRISGCQDLDYWQRLKKLSLMSLQRRRERYIILHMWKLLHGHTSNDLQIQFHAKPRKGILAIVPSLNRVSSLRHQSLYDNSFAVMGPRLWNSIPYNLNTIEKFVPFKNMLTTFVLAVPDKPPVRGYSTPNSNSLLAWRVDNSVSILHWGGQNC